MPENTKQFLFQAKLSTSLFYKKHRPQILLLIAALTILTTGVFLQQKLNIGSQSIEVLQTPTDTSIPQNSSNNIVVDVSGAVVNPGVYTLPLGSRIEEALVKSGGLSQNADTTWIDKNLNRAAKLTDGQKIYIPSLQSNQSSNVAQSANSFDSNLININAASLSQLESLPGIGQSYGQSIIDHRPYSDINDLVNQKIVPQKTFAKIQNLITLY